MINIKTFEYFKNDSFKIGDHVYLIADKMFKPCIIEDITNEYYYFYVKEYETGKTYFCKIYQLKKMTRKESEKYKIIDDANKYNL
jgi:hypothetical protein